MAKYRNMPLPSLKAYSRVQALLPKLKEENQKLEKQLQSGERKFSDVDIENISDDADYYCEMVFIISSVDFPSDISIQDILTGVLEKQKTEKPPEIVIPGITDSQPTQQKHIEELNSTTES